MRYLAAVPVLATLLQANADSVVDMSLVFKAQPQLRTLKPEPTTVVNRVAIGSSIQARLNEEHKTPGAGQIHTTKPLNAKSTGKAHKNPTKAKSAPKHTTKVAPKPKHTTEAHLRHAQAKGKQQHKHAKRQATASSATASSVSAASTAAASSSAVCQAQSYPLSYTPSPNTPSGFFADQTLAGFSVSALAPPGFTAAFKNQFASLYGNQYMGYIQTASYNISTCSSYCTSIGCSGFNIYYELDPTANPDPVSCPNPNSTVSVRCAFYGSAVNSQQVQNFGGWRSNFMVVVAGSNGYNVNTPPPTYQNFSAPVALAGAIMTTSGSTYINSAYFANAWAPGQCVAACQNLTASNKASAASNSSAQVQGQAVNYQACNFVNAFKMSLNGTLQGTYCKMYTSAAVAVNATVYSLSAYGQNYDLTYSYGYTLSTYNAGVVGTPANSTLSTQSCSNATNGLFDDSNGNIYNLVCNADLKGVGDIGYAANPSGTAATCGPICDNFAGCQAFTALYNGANGGTCFLKTLVNATMSGLVSNTGTDVGYLAGAFVSSR